MDLSEVVKSVVDQKVSIVMQLRDSGRETSAFILYEGEYSWDMALEMGKREELREIPVVICARERAEFYKSKYSNPVFMDSDLLIRNYRGEVLKQTESE